MRASTRRTASAFFPTASREIRNHSSTCPKMSFDAHCRFYWTSGITLFSYTATRGNTGLGVSSDVCAKYRDGPSHPYSRSIDASLATKFAYWTSSSSSSSRRRELCTTVDINLLGSEITLETARASSTDTSGCEAEWCSPLMYIKVYRFSYVVETYVHRPSLKTASYLSSFCAFFSLMENTRMFRCLHICIVILYAPTAFTAVVIHMTPNRTGYSAMFAPAYLFATATIAPATIGRCISNMFGNL
mmetsp:Transcript_6770/g.20530  ORF Transcript_6770/g.20530 Transcript_6770/m.20530 type:complete len:245 (+) Transcript_6770:284-1018(+)